MRQCPRPLEAVTVMIGALSDLALMVCSAGTPVLIADRPWCDCAEPHRMVWHPVSQTWCEHDGEPMPFPSQPPIAARPRAALALAALVHAVDDVVGKILYASGTTAREATVASELRAALVAASARMAQRVPSDHDGHHEAIPDQDDHVDGCGCRTRHGADQRCVDKRDDTRARLNRPDAVWHVLRCGCLTDAGAAGGPYVDQRCADLRAAG